MSAVEDVIGVFQRWLYMPKPEGLLAILGAVAANRMKGDPVWLLTVGPPGGGKSEMLQAILGIPGTHPAATMTERALLSGTAKKEREASAKGGLLREIGSYGILVCKDFGSILSMHRDERARTLAALREVYDGSWTRHVGVDGGRTLSWTGKVGLIAGCTPTIDSHHAVMGAMGERFVLFRLPVTDDSAQARKALAHVGLETQMRAELYDCVKVLFTKAAETPRVLSEAERNRLIALAKVVVRCRSSVERDSHSREIELVPGSEAPTRLVIVLATMLAGLDVIGVEREKAWDVVIQIALDSMPRLRHDLVVNLYESEEPRSTTELSVEVRHPTTTTRRSLEDLTAHYVVERHSQGQGKAAFWSLADWAKDSLNQAIKALPGGESDFSGTPGNETSPEMSIPLGSNRLSNLFLNPNARKTTKRERLEEDRTNGDLDEDPGPVSAPSLLDEDIPV